MGFSLQRLGDWALGLLFPDQCVGCGAVGNLWCAACRARLRPYPPQQVLTALHMLNSGQAGPRNAPPLLDGVRIGFVFEGSLREAIHALKYQGQRRMAAPLADLLASHLYAHPLAADALVPVPLHAHRLAERGFNQSSLLAAHLSERCHIPLLDNRLVRWRDTPPQVGLNAQQRLENVRQAFGWQGTPPPPPRVIVLDDVLTTGATVLACALVLRQAGARQVFVLTLARSSA